MSGKRQPRSTQRRTSAIGLMVCASFTLLFSLRARADEPKITLGPGAMTFPEIAQQLSTDGRRVQCPVGLKDCAAWVFLKQRTWAQTRDLLGAGLDVEFAPDAKKANVWALRRDAATLRREQKLLNAYEANLVEHAHERADAQMRGFVVGNSPAFAATRQRMDEMDKENLAIIHNPNSTPADIKRRNKLMDDMMAMPAAIPENWVLGLMMPREMNLASIDAAIHSGPRIQALERGALPHDVQVGLYVLNTEGVTPKEKGYITRPWRDVVADTPLPDDFTVWSGLRYDPVNLSIQLKGGISANGAFHELSRSVDAAFYYLPASVFRADTRGVAEHPWPGLGKEANVWLEAQRANTRSFLQTEAARRPFVPRSARPLTSVSQIVEQWSREQNAEAVMELLPTREPLNQYGSDMGQKLDVEAPVSGRACRLDALFSDEDAWQFQRQDGALVVKDMFAFSDRLRHYPLDAFLKLERRMESESVAGVAPAAPSLQDMLAYARDVPPGQSAPWGWMAGYRGMASNTLTLLPPLLHLLGRLPRSQQEKIVTDLCRQAEADAARKGAVKQEAGTIDSAKEGANNAADAKPIPNPLARRLAVRDWEYLLAEYRDMPHAFPNWAWNPNALAILQSCALRAKVTHTGLASKDALCLYLEYPDPASPWAATLLGNTLAVVSVPGG